MTVIKRWTGTVWETVSNEAVSVAIDQAQSHGSPDTNTSAVALHHTLGTSPTQAAAGNHEHGLSNLGSSLEAVPLFVYGNSYTVFPNAGGRSTTNGEWTKRLTDRLRMRKGLDAGLAGSVAPQIWFEANNNAYGATDPSRKWVVGSNGLVVYEETINDVVTFGGLAAAKSAYRDSLRALIELWGCSSRVDATDAGITYSAGDWTSGTAYLVNDGRKTVVSGATATFTFTGTACTLYVYGLSGAAPQVTVKEGATTLATEDLSYRSGTWDPPGFVGTTAGLSVIPIRITGLSAGSHTLVLTSTGAGTTYFDGYSLPSETPPQTILLVEGEITAYYLGSKAIHDEYTQILRDVAAEYPARVSVADPGAAWDKNTCLQLKSNTGGSDTGNHPNDLGMGVLADAVTKTALTLGYRSGMNVMTGPSTRLPFFVPLASLEKGAANGLATLDAAGKIPSSQLPTGGVGVPYVQHYVSGTTTASGYLTVLHTAGFTPRLAIAFSTSPGSNANPFACDLMNATGTRFRFASILGGVHASLATGTFSVAYWA